MSKPNSAFRTFVVAYLECALWAETASGVPEDTGDGAFDISFDSYGFSFDDIAPAERLKAIRDCRDFWRRTELADFNQGSPEQHGHDFWLTRNHHGAGFWDRGYGRDGEDLTKHAHSYGGRDLYVGDDGQIYGF